MLDKLFDLFDQTGSGVLDSSGWQRLRRRTKSGELDNAQLRAAPRLRSRKLSAEQLEYAAATQAGEPRLRARTKSGDTSEHHAQL